MKLYFGKNLLRSLAVVFLFAIHGAQADFIDTAREKTFSAAGYVLKGYGKGVAMILGSTLTLGLTVPALFAFHDFYSAHKHGDDDRLWKTGKFMWKATLAGLAAYGTYSVYNFDIYNFNLGAVG